jgi:hypothetical protein
MRQYDVTIVGAANKKDIDNGKRRDVRDNLKISP